MKRLLLLSVLLLNACTNTTDGILTEEVCIKSHSSVSMIPVYSSDGNGNTSLSYMYIPEDVCDVAVTYNFPNPDYRKKNG